MTVYYFLGILCAFGLTIFLILDLDRKRKRLRQIVIRLEPIVHGQTRHRVRFIRRLSLSLFLYEQLVRQLHKQIAAVEEENGIETPELPKHDWIFFEKRLSQIEQRVEKLEEVLT